MYVKMLTLIVEPTIYRARINREHVGHITKTIVLPSKAMLPV